VRELPCKITLPAKGGTKMPFYSFDSRLSWANDFGDAPRNRRRFVDAVAKDGPIAIDVVASACKKPVTAEATAAKIGASVDEAESLLSRMAGCGFLGSVTTNGVKRYEATQLGQFFCAWGGRNPGMPKKNKPKNVCKPSDIGREDAE
jgi:hypothetical protein